jgi:hypothetical protein
MNDLCIFLVLRVRVSSRTRSGCHPRALFILVWSVTTGLYIIFKDILINYFIILTVNLIN